jgi:hypothetical protein
MPLFLCRYDEKIKCHENVPAYEIQDVIALADKRNDGNQQKGLVSKVTRKPLWVRYTT